MSADSTMDTKKDGRLYSRVSHILKEKFTNLYLVIFSDLIFLDVKSTPFYLHSKRQIKSKRDGQQIGTK